MAATVGNERSRLWGRGAISEGIFELKKRDCEIRQKLGRIRQEIRHFPVAIHLYLPGISKYSMVSELYTCENTVHIADFRGAYRDAALRESVQLPEVQPPVDLDEADPRPAAENDEFFQAPDAQSKEEAINKFLDGMEGLECSGFKDIH